MRVIAVTGMNREAKLIDNGSVDLVVSGADPAQLVRRLDAAIERIGRAHVAGIMSIGLGGGLDPGLKPGDAVIGEAVAAPDRRFETDVSWTKSLKRAFPEARTGVIAGQDAPAADPDNRRRLRQSTGAICVDMESHVSASLADKLSLPFAALRFISDGADRTLPQAALAGIRPDGSIALRAVLAALARNPFQLAALIRTGVEAEAAFKALLGSCRRLGPTLGLGDV